MDQNEIIDLYLMGLLHGEELDKFLLELNANEALAEAVDTRAQIIEAIQEVRKQELKDYIAAQTQKSKTIHLPGPGWVYASAAAVLLIGAAFFLFQDQIPKQVNPVVIFQPKDKFNLELDTAQEEVVMQETPKPEKVEEVLEIEEDTTLDMEEDFVLKPEFAEIQTVEDEVVVRQDKIVRANSIFMIDHKKKQLKDSVVANQVPAMAREKDVSTLDKKKSIESTKATVPSSEIELKAPMAEGNSKVHVEIWQSIIGFKGYKWNGKTLRLYSIDSAAHVEIHNLDKTTYLEINKEFYYLKLTDNYERYQKITDAALIERLKK